MPGVEWVEEVQNIQMWLLYTSGLPHNVGTTAYWAFFLKFIIFTFMCNGVLSVHIIPAWYPKEI